ncbi:GGDEF domain-containing protein [Pleionea sediminis]|uniref:GGDEF domain-containing protein n=1 Tax=Pleionea sediminis TaxID=2569479 RepID=UPI00118646E6|nr:GGDEF domain-containing protein [Pleionea sediminis]
MNVTDNIPYYIYKQALDNALDIIVISEVDKNDPGNNPIIYVNDSFTHLFGYEKDEVIGKSARILHGEDTDIKSRDKIREAITQGWPIHTEIANYGKNGKKFWIDLKMVPLYDDRGEVTHFLFIERDLSDRKSREEQLYQKATIDGLTKIFNRQHTYQLATKTLEKTIRYQEHLCLLLLDIDHFKAVNDTYGHQVGDDVLTKLASILKEQVRKADILGRVGGEEFLIVLPEIAQDEALIFAERIRKCVKQADWSSLGLKDKLTISIGLACYKHNSLEELIKHADKALYQAKNDGRDQVQIYSSESE